MTPAAPAWVRATFAAAAVVLLGAPLLDEAWAFLAADTVAIPESLEGEVLDVRAEDFALEDLSGRTVRLSDYRGRTVFLNFWATWCPPCVEELPSMVALESAMTGYDFAILAVSEDESAEDVRRFFGGSLPAFDIVLDEDQRVTRRFGTFKFPETYVIDAGGRIRARFVGSRKWDSPDAVAFLRRVSG